MRSNVSSKWKIKATNCFSGLFFFFFPVIGNNFIWLGAVSPAVNQKVTKSALANLPEIDTL